MAALLFSLVLTLATACSEKPIESNEPFDFGSGRIYTEAQLRARFREEFEAEKYPTFGCFVLLAMNSEEFEEWLLKGEEQQRTFGLLSKTDLRRVETIAKSECARIVAD